MSIIYTATKVPDGRHLVTYPTPGCDVPTVACDCATAAQALDEAERLTAESKQRDADVARDRELRIRGAGER